MKCTALYRNARILVFIAILIIYFSVISFINFSAVPSFYDADMYCDYRYAMGAWEHKSIFPDGWVFGNQLNAVSTPVLAALLYGVTGNLNLSMAAACVIMGVLLVFSYDWMIKAALKETESRLVAIVLFITVTLYCGRAVHGNQGWTLFFTMCSYYAGYGMTAFLAFGAYLRAFSLSFRKNALVMVAACVLSFGTGIQSIRQTAIMVGPLLAVEFLRFLASPKQWKENMSPLVVATAITISNLLGLCYVRMREISQNQIFGKIEFTSLTELGQATIGCFSLIKDLLGADHPEAVFILAGIAVVCVGSLILILKKFKGEKNPGALILSLLVCASVVVIVVIDIFTTMHVRPRYYFMLYPLMAFLIAYVYDNQKLRIRWSLFALVVCFFCTAFVREIPKICTIALMQEEDACYEISDYLLENGYTTVYAEWNHGHDVAIASNGKINVGYWYAETGPYEKITHLCSLDIYNTDPNRCAYLFVGEVNAQIGITVAESAGIPLKFLYHETETDTYLYTASSNLMQ